MEIKTVSIVGMGALGILYGEFLTKKLGKDRVGFVVDEERRKKYEDYGITSNGVSCDFRMISDQETGTPADLLIVAVKATSLDAALETAQHQVGKGTLILSLLNGITSEAIIGERFGPEKTLICVAQGMDALKIGPDMTYSKIGQLRIGTLQEDSSGLDAVQELFESIGLPYVREKEPLRRLWGKFMINVGVNQVVMVYEGTFATVQKPGEPRELMIAAMREVIDLSVAEGINIPEEELAYYVDIIDSLSPEGMPSMRQDGVRRVSSELELFSGTVIRLAKKHQLRVPVNERLYQRIREMEEEYS